MRVLLVEDTESLRSLFVRLLERCGFEVCPAEDGQQGLDALETFDPDVIVTDLAMPVMDGVEFIEKVRLTLEIPIVAMTADGCSETERKAIRAGATFFIVKPLEFSMLIECLRTVTELDILADGGD